MAETTSKLTGVKLLHAIKSEIEATLTDQDVSEIDLFLAAQNLIDLARKDYVERDFHEHAGRAGYYSHEVDRALDNLQATIWKNEIVGWHDEGDPMRFHDHSRKFFQS